MWSNLNRAQQRDLCCETPLCRSRVEPPCFPGNIRWLSNWLILRVTSFPWTSVPSPVMFYGPLVFSLFWETFLGAKRGVRFERRVAVLTSVELEARKSLSGLTSVLFFSSYTNTCLLCLIHLTFIQIQNNNICYRTFCSRNRVPLNDLYALCMKLLYVRTVLELPSISLWK